MKRVVVILAILALLGASEPRQAVAWDPGSGPMSPQDPVRGRGSRDGLLTGRLEIAQEPWGIVQLVDVPREVELDEELRLRFSFVIIPGAQVQVGEWIGFELIAPEGVWTGELEVPEPERIENEGFGDLRVHREDFVAELPIRVPSAAFEGAGEVVLDGRLRLRGADESQVYLPVTRRFELPLRIASRGGPPVRVVDEFPEETPWLAIAAILVAGLGALLFLLRRR